MTRHCIPIELRIPKAASTTSHCNKNNGCRQLRKAGRQRNWFSASHWKQQRCTVTITFTATKVSFPAPSQANNDKLCLSLQQNKHKLFTFEETKSQLTALTVLLPFFHKSTPHLFEIQSNQNMECNQFHNKQAAKGETTTSNATHTCTWQRSGTKRPRAWLLSSTNRPKISARRGPPGWKWKWNPWDRTVHCVRFKNTQWAKIKVSADQTTVFALPMKRSSRLLWQVLSFAGNYLEGFDSLRQLRKILRWSGGNADVEPKVLAESSQRYQRAQAQSCLCLLLPGCHRRWHWYTKSIEACYMQCHNASTCCTSLVCYSVLPIQFVAC